MAHIPYHTDSDTRVAHVAVFLRRTMMNCQRTPQETADGRFPVTRWSVVVAARGDGDSARRALNELCAQYWLPVYSFMYLDEPGHHLTPDLEFERQWVLALLDRALDIVRVAAAESAQAGLFEDLKGLISLASPVAPYEDIAFRHGLSESAVKSTAQRLRQEFRTVVRALVAETVASDEEIDDEIRHLFTLFAS
jgi:RNA polymerase sigma-70 factor (ECF subfamily)